METPPHAPPSRLPTLDSDVLRSFVTIADTGSFTAAAREVHRTPAALSMQIKGLETTLGQTLFVRGARRVTVTEHGVRLLPYARRLLALNAEAVSAFLDPPVTGAVSLGLPDDLARIGLTPTLRRLALSHPGVQVQVIAAGSRGLAARIDDGTLDVALVCVGNDDLSVAAGAIISHEPMVWAAPIDSRALHARPLPLALAHTGCAWRHSALAALDAADIDYRIAYSSESGTGQSAAASADLAVAALPARLVAAPLVVRDELPAMAPTGIGLLARPALASAGQALVSSLQGAFATRSP
ncbi:LysR family transcriptional regulator [Salinisphaera sp. Q1T1-3]|uniref:LysR family transcriptional regulator n=1 Tax=Salinisphaera sp. Q1T1-3 TaxID=2321229 RepID=UPI000E74FEEB|nr:LysR family transcriptional regulator [Salinisphaera sp. Q1T1-3]RJS93065.1 LysR family transcriptional regulator [Salinisphaera sp. Q1T1-3]